MPGKPTPRPSEAALIGQTREPRNLRPGDPRARRAANMRSTDAIAGAYVIIDQNGRISVDFDALYRAVKARIDAEAAS